MDQVSSRGVPRGDYERPWKRIAADLRAKIMNGHFRPGERLPTIADLQREYVEDGKLRAKNTVRGALNQLRDEGLIESRNRSYYVREQ